MADLTAQQIKQLYAAGDADRISMYALRNVNTADQVDLAASFSLVKRALLINVTNSGQAVCTVAGTIVTMPSGLSGDAAYILVWGCATGG